MSDNLYDAVAKLNQQPQNTNGADYFNQAKQRQLSKFVQAVQRNNAQVNANPYLPNTVSSLTQYNPNELTQDTVTGDSNWLNTQPNQQNTNILQDLGTSWDMGVNSSSNSFRAKWAEIKNGGGDTSRGVYDAYVLANNQAGLPSVSYEKWKAKKEAGNTKTYKELTQQDNQYFKNTQENEQLYNQLSKRYHDSLQNKNEIAKTINEDNQTNAIQKWGFGVINNLANPYQAVVNASQSTPTLAGTAIIGSVTGGTGALAFATLSEGLSSENDVYNATMQSKGANFDPNDPNLLEAKSNAFLVGAGSTALGGALAKRVGGADLDNASTFIKKGGNVAGSVIDIAEENAIAYGTSKSIEQATGQKQDHIGSMADATVSTLALNSGMAGFGKGVQGLTSIGAFGFDKTKQAVSDYTTNKTSKQAPVMLDPTSNKYDPVGLYNTAKANESKYKDTDKTKYEQATKIVNDIHNHIQDTIADYDTQIQEATDDVTREKAIQQKELFLQNYANEITTRESTQDSLDDSVEQQILNNITKSGTDDVIQTHAKNTQDLLEKIYGKVKNNESLTDDDLTIINETIQSNRDKLATLTQNKAQTLTDEFHKISDFSREPKKVEALNKRLNLNLHTQDFEQDGLQFQGDFFSYGATDYKQIAKDVKGQPDTLIKDGKFFKQKDGKWFQLLTDDDANKWTKAYNDDLSAYLNKYKSSTTTKPITPHNFTDIKVNKASDIPHKFRIPFANINGKSAHFSGGIIKADTLGFMQLLDNDDEIANLAVGFTSITGGKHRNNSAVSHGTGFKFDLDLKNGDDVQTYKRIGQKVADLAKQHGYDVIVNAEKKGWGSIGKQGDVNFINGGGSHLDIVVKGRLNANQTTQTTTQNSIVKSSWSNQKVWRNLKNNTNFDDVMSSTYSKYGFSLAEQQVLKAQLAQESGLKNLQTNNNWGAGGIAQFIDGTAKKYGINKFDPVQAIDGQARYMKDLLNKYNGDWAKALASYNTGEGNVDKHWGTDGTGQGGGVMTMRWNKGNGETLKYVENILAHAGSMTINGQSAPVQNTQTTQNIQTNQAPLNTANVTIDTDTTGTDELTSKISELEAQIKALQDASTKVAQTTTKADTTQSGKPIDVSNDVDIQFNQLVKRYSRIQTDDEIATAQSKLNDLEKAGYDTNKVLALRQLLEAKIAIRGSNIQETQSQVYYGRNGKGNSDTNLGIKQYADVFERAVQTGNTNNLPKYLDWLDSFTTNHTQKAKALNEAFEMNEPVKVANVKGKGWTIMPMDSMFDGSIVGNVYTINENSKNLVEQINKEATALSIFTNAWNQVLTPMLKNKSKSNFDVNQFLPKNPIQEQVIQKEQVTQEPVKTNQQKPVVNNERLKELNHHNQGLDDDKEHYVGMVSTAGNMRSLYNEDSRDEKGSWGNPYGIGINGGFSRETVKHSINSYNELLKERLQDDKAIKSLLGLRGKTLTYVKNNDKYPSKQSANLLDYYVNNIPEELVKQNDYKGIKEWINNQSISFNDDGLFEVKQPKKQIQANKKDKKSVDTSNRQQVFTGRDITKDLIKRLDNDLQKQAMDIFDVNDLDELVEAVFDYKNSEIRDSEKDELITYLKDDWQEHISLKPKERSKITSNSKHKKSATNSIGLLGKDESVSFENKQEPSVYETGSHNLSDWFYDTKDTLDDDEYKTIIEVLLKKYPDLTISFDDSKADIKGGNTQEITAQLVIYSTQKINGLLNEYVQEDNKVDKQMNGLIGSLAFVRNNIKQYLKTKEAKELSKEVKETLKQITQSKDPTLLYNKAIKDKAVQDVLKSIKVENGKVKGNLFSRIIKGITSFLGFKYDTVDNLYEKVLQTAGDTAKLQYNEFGVKVDAKLTALKNANPKDELNKPLKEQEIFKAYVTQSKKPLSSVINLITELNIQRGKLIQKLGMGKPNQEQSIQLDHFITFNNQFEEHLIHSFGAVSDKKYAYKDLKNYFLNDDGSIDENVLTAMSTAVYDYMIVNSSISKDIKGIGKLLGVSEDDIKNTHISGELIKKYKYIGESNTIVALDIGKSVATLLGLDINENAPNDLLSKLHASIGAWAISAMQSADLVHINKLNSNEYENDKALVNGKNQQVLEDSKQEISFVSVVTPDGENLNPLIREIQKLNKGTMGYLMNLMGGSSKEKYPSLDKPKKVKTKIKGTNSTVSQKQQDIIDKAQQEAYVVNESMLSVMQSLSELDNNKFMQMVGAKVTDATLNKMQISKRESAISKAENMATALQSALDWVDVVPSIDGVRKFYDTMFVAKNDRMHLNSTVFNVQSNKLHRAMADNESFKINLGKVDNKPVWFKNGKITPMGYFIRAVFENAEGTEDYFKNKLKDKYKQGFTVDKVSTQDFNDVAWEYLNTDEVQTAIKAMQAVQNGTGTKDDVAVIYAMVKAWGMEGSSLRALVEASNLFTAIENKTEFVTSLGLQSDGINNGIAIGTYLLGVMDNVFNNMVGLFSKNDTHQDYFSTRLDFELNDYYEGLKSYLEDSIKSKKQSLEESIDEAKTDKQKNFFEKQLNNLNAIEFLNSTLTGRKTLKAILIPFGYGSGFDSLTRAGSRQMMTDIYERMEEITTDKELNDLNKNLSILLDKDIEITHDELLTYEFSKKDEALLQTAYVDLMKGIISDALKAYAPKMIYARKITNGLHSATSQAYISAFIELSNKALQDKQDKLKEQYKELKPTELKAILDFHKLTKKEIDEQVFAPLSKAFPTIKTGYTVGEETTESDIELIQKTTQLDFETGVESVNYMFDGEALAKVTANLGIRIHTFTDTGVTGHSQAVQSSDSVNSSYAMVLQDGTVNQNVHDANIGAIDKQVQMGQAQNKGFYHNLINYHENIETIKATVKTLSQLDTAGLLTKEIADNFINSLSSNPRVQFVITSELLNKNHSTKELLNTIVNDLVLYAKEQETKKLKALQELSVVQQYGTEGGQYTPTQDDYKLIDEQLQKIDSIDLSLDLQSDLGKTYFIQGIHYNTFESFTDLAYQITYFEKDEQSGKYNKEVFNLDEFHQAIDDNPHKVNEYVDILFKEENLKDRLQFPISESKVHSHGISLSNLFMDKLFKENPDVYNERLQSVYDKAQIELALFEGLDTKLYDNSTSNNDVSTEFFGLGNAVNIYNKLPNKSITGNVTLDKSGAIYSLRSNNRYHFGNPFSSTVKNKGLIGTKSTKESVVRYIDWVINSNDDRANWIRQQIQIGKIKDKPIYYYKELNEASHATALDYLINKYNWENNKTKQYNLEGLIESVRKTVEKGNKDQQANIQLLGFVFDAMKQFNYDIKIKMTDLGSHTINGKTYKNQGVYDVSTNTLELDNDWFSTASNTAKQTVIAHELLHALTEQSINNPKGKLVQKAVTDLTSMREQLLDVYNGLSDKLDPKLIAKLDLMFDFDENYQLGALGEFVAYGMTDKDIRQFINTHLKTDTKTSIKKGFKDKLDRFLNAVHTMLGLKGKKPFDDFAKSVSQLVGKYETNEQGRLFSKSVDAVAETHKPKNTNEQININQLDNINPKRFSRIQSDNDVVSEVNDMTAIEAIKTLKHNVSDEFNKHLDNTIDKVFGKYAYNQTNKKKVLDSIKVKTVQFFAIGLGLSDKESAVYEAHKTILDEFIKTKADTQAVNELYKIREQFIKQFGSAKDLASIYGTDWDKLDKVSQRQLTNLHKHLLSGTHSVAKIVSLVTASYKFNSFMNVDRVKLNQKATGSWFDKLMTIIQNVLDWFNNMTAGNNSRLYTKSVSNITNKLIKIDVASRNKQTGYYDKAWKATGYVGNFASKTLYKGVYLGAKAVGAKEVSQLAKGLSKRYISSDDIAEQLANDIDTTHIPNKYYGEIRNVVNEIAGAGNMRTMVEKLTRLVQSTAQTRQKIKTAVSNTLQQVFDDKPSKEVKSALGRVLVRTDIQSLLETMNSTQAIAMLFNDDKRHAKIVELTDKLLELQDGQAIVNQTKALSAYMVDQVTAPNLVKNAYGIAYGLGRTGQNYDDNVRQVIDTLTTLQAIEYTNNDYINLIKPYKDSPDKLVAVIKQHKAIVDKDKEEFKHNPFNMQKGFGSDLVDPHKSIKYISLEDTKAIQKALAEGWEQVVEELPQDKNDLAPVVAMFYHPSISYTRRVSGALDLADSHTKGTSVYSELDNNDYLNQVIQSRANDLAQIGKHKEFNPYDYSGSLVASYGTDGRVIELHYEMHGFTRDNLLERSHDVFEMLGTMAGTSNFKPLIRESQKQVAKVLKKDFVDNYKINPSLFVLLDPNSSDPKVRDDFRQLPYAMRKELSDEFGMGKPIYIRASAYNGILGYKKYSVKDIWDKAYRINESIEQGFRPTEKLNNIEKFVMLLFKPFGLKSKGLAGQIEELVQHIVGGIKDFIVIRNVRVIIGNILSNSLLLMLHGIDPITMIKGYTKAWTQGQRYNKWQNEYHELESQLAFVKPSEKARINGQMRLLKERMANSSVNVFMQAGMMNTIVEDVTLFKEESDFKSPLEKKINKVTNKIPKEVKTVFDWLMVAPTTPAHKFLADATQFSDFGAKLVLAEHLMKKGMSANKAMSEAQDNFINFDVPTSKGMQYMNDVGLFMFTKFFLRFQRVIVRMFKEKPAQVLAQHYGVEYFTDVAGFLDPFMGFRIGNNPFHASVFSGVGVVDDGVPLFNLVGGF